ncbi:ATP-binding cassette domain-containing protein [uncultured Bifidobacterium sp.]|uniref:ATP-binding cassette domain-containing protein n=1 Tax=uncultured Bifidobacterium sp. TaxID=165187 RepID=UPI00258EA87A|nr:ATP-binding cassette domain-containing protein [uncultured Bifidobacterium sp.]MEE0654751.1 ATP-binding cassette domain-containing protein [Bifidobacterium criceti]
MATHPTNLIGRHISFSYDGVPDALFDGIDVTLPQGWTALLGDNGCGKTTLATIILGRLTPTEGTINPSPSTFVGAYCAQECTTEPTNLDAFANDWSPSAIAVRDMLGIGDDWPYRFLTLSGGERKRLQVACAIASNPDVLVLDEPTNHVDADTRAAIASAMRAYDGIGVLVSHDIELIDATCTQCLMFERRHVDGRNRTVLERYAGGYTKASRTRERRTNERADELKAAHDAQRSIRQSQDKRRAMMNAASARKHGGWKIDRHDHDARNTHKWNEKQADKASAAAYRALGSRLEAAERAAASIETDAKRYDGEILVDIAPSARRELAHIDAGVIRFGDAVETDDCVAVSELVVDGTHWHTCALDAAQPLGDAGIRVPRLSVGPRDHIGIDGANGTGKSTVVRALLASVADTLPTLTITQIPAPDAHVRLLDELRHLDNGERAHVLSMAAQLNADPDRMTSGEQLSPGEAQKLALCLGLLRAPQLIMLDEPTNHLDVHSKQALSRFLRGYAGALVTVSHERWFLDEVCGFEDDARTVS